jgi:hypothetical protein
MNRACLEITRPKPAPEIGLMPSEDFACASVRRNYRNINDAICDNLPFHAIRLREQMQTQRFRQKTVSDSTVKTLQIKLKSLSYVGRLN